MFLIKSNHESFLHDAVSHQHCAAFQIRPNVLSQDAFHENMPLK